MNRIALACERARTLDIDPQRTALACIDFQADFVVPGGLAATRGLNVGPLEAALAPAAGVLKAARDAGLLVFHTRECYAPDLSDLNMFRRRHDSAIGREGPLGRFLIRGQQGTEIVESMRPRSGEPVIDKAGFNAFHQTALDTILRGRGIESLLLMGFTTQCCVSSTMRGAVDLGYECVLLSDASAAYDPEDHGASIRVMYSESDNFGWVSDSARVAQALGSALQK